MIANRVTGPTSPEPNRNPAANKVQREQAQRVEKVREIDPDEQAKQRRRDQFSMMMQDKEDAESTAPRVPSPFETQFYSTDAATDSPLAQNGAQSGIPGPAYSPPPTLSPSIEEGSANEDLPQSPSFWHSVSLPDQPPPETEVVAEGEGLQNGKGKAAAASPLGTSPKNGGTGAPSSDTKSPNATKDSKTSSPSGKLPAKKEPTATPSGRYWSPAGEERAPSSPGTVKGTSPKDKPGMAVPSSPSDVEKSPISTSQRGTGAGFLVESEPGPKAMGAGEEKKGSEKSSSNKKTVDVTPSLPSFPPSVQSVAVAAMTVASPYLSPETLPLFYQMVGSILVMSTPQGGGKGVSTYEIALNSPAFAQSRFYGSTIEIVRYSTAPDSYNIRLSGSNEAVQSFNQNIPSLAASFQESLQRGLINFRIGRLEAAYSNERPVFRRRDRDKGSTAGGGGGFDRGGK